MVFSTAKAAILEQLVVA